VELRAPQNGKLDNHMFMVEYVDFEETEKIVLIDIKTKDKTVVKIKNGEIADKNIIGWSLISRATTKGYARLYGLIPPQSIHIYFENNVVISGKITDLIEDMIELTPSDTTQDVIYIDFGYKGIPEDLNIEKIEFDEGEETNSPKGEITEKVLSEDDTVDEIEEQEYNIYVEIPDNEKMYGIDVQTSDLLEKMLAKILPFKRTPSVLKHVHILIERFKQLRRKWHVFNNHGYIEKQTPHVFNPLATEWNRHKLSWFVPTVTRAHEDNSPLRDDRSLAPSGGSKKKIYYLNADEKDQDTIPADISFTSFYDTTWSDSKLIENKILGEGQTLYQQYLLNVQNSFRPFVTEKSRETTVNVHVTQDVLVETENMWDSHIADIQKTLQISNFSCLTERILPSHRQLSGTEVTQEGEIQNTYMVMPSDHVQFKSILLLPEEQIKNSVVSLPRTGIRERIIQSHTPFLGFMTWNKDALQSEQIVVKDKKMPDKWSWFNSLNKITHIQNLDQIADVWDLLFPSFEKQIPFFSNHMKFLSLQQLIQTMEPFLIYHDNVNYDLSKQMRHLVDDKISQYRKQKKPRAYSKVNPERRQQQICSFNPTLWSMTEEGAPQVASTCLMDVLFDLKKEESEIKEKMTILFQLHPNYTSSEWLSIMTKKQCGEWLNAMISYVSYPLITPDTWTKRDRTFHFLDISELEQSAFDKDVAFMPIYKIYNNQKKMENDNKKPVVVDSELDIISSEVYKFFKTEQKKFKDSKEDFEDFIKQTLMSKYKCSKEQTPIWTHYILDGHFVENGDRAVMVKVLTGKPMTSDVPPEDLIKQHYTYYKRVNDTWELDTDEPANSIDPLEAWLKIIQTSSKWVTPLSKQNVQNDYIATVGETVSELKKKINLIGNVIKKKQMLEEYKNKPPSVKASAADKEAPVVLSPHLPLQSWILSEHDFVKKQYYIVQFYAKYCRDPDSDEDEHWGYCREVKTKLFPISLYLLALAFQNGNYPETLESLIFKWGEPSTDGESIIDRFTGHVLKRLDSSSEEGYDEMGFKIITHAVMEKDAMDVILKELEGKKFDNETAEKIYKVFHFLKQTTELTDSLNTIEDFVIKHSVRFLCKAAQLPQTCVLNDALFLTEAQFLKQEKENEKKKNYKKKTYSAYVNQNIITMTLCFYLIAIQTAIPPVKPRKTFPFCIYSYDGFPMTSEEQTGGVDYLCCVIRIATKNTWLINNSPELWKSLTSIKVEEMTFNMKSILHYLIVNASTKDSFLEQLYLLKKQYILVSDQKKEQMKMKNAGRWMQFVPPLFEFKIQNKLSLDSGFYEELDKMRIFGNRTLQTLLYTLQTKIKQNSFRILQLIREVVSNQKNALHVSFIQNACCNDTSLTHPLLYFIDKNPKIKECLKTSRDQILNYNLFRNYAEASIMYYHVGAMGRAKLEVRVHSFSKINIYKAFIHFGHYNYDVLLEDDIQLICPPKPLEYSPNFSIEKNIEIMEKAEIALTPENLIHLMQKIHHRNMIESYSNSEIKNPTSEFMVFLHAIAESQIEGIQTGFSQEMISRMISIFEKSKKDRTQLIPIENIEDAQHDRLLDLIEYFSVHCEKKYNDITERLITYRGQDKTNQALDYLKYMLNFKPNDGTFLQTLQNSLFRLCVVYPQSISRSERPNTWNYLQHWNLSWPHNTKLTENYNRNYEGLNSFVDVDDILLRTWLHKMSNSENGVLSVYLKFIELLPIYTELELQVDDNIIPCYHILNHTAIEFIYKYIWFSVVESYLTESVTLEMQKKSKGVETQQLEFTDHQSAFVEKQDLIQWEGITKNEIQSFKIKINRFVEVLLLADQINTRSILNWTYDDIKRETFRLTDKEEKDVVTRIGNYSAFEKSIDKLHRQLKLGVYYADVKKLAKDPDYLENKISVALVTSEDISEIPPDFYAGGEGEENIGFVNPMYDEDANEENADGEVMFDFD
jgi:hypothetical protein